MMVRLIANFLTNTNKEIIVIYFGDKNCAGEMDYKTYLDFVLALENRQEPQSLQYLFRILDFDHQGYLTSFTLNYFFKVKNEPNISILQTK